MADYEQKGLNTPYDSAFKSIIKKCPRMALFLINEMFYKTGLIDEQYDGTEQLRLLDKELPDLELGNLEMDLRLEVWKRLKRVFHLECESLGENVILRMVRYDTRSALEEAVLENDTLHLKIDDSGVLYLRSRRRTPSVMTVVLEVPQGKSVTYQVPVLKLQDYTLAYVLENRLYILLPFLFFNYEKQLRKSPNNQVIYEEIEALYDTILNELKSLEEAGTITAYEASTLFDALKVVFEALGKTNQAEKEVSKIMGGRILEFSADKYYNAGVISGETRGETRGAQQKELSNIQNLMTNLHFTAAQAMDALSVPQEERSKYATLLAQ